MLLGARRLKKFLKSLPLIVAECPLPETVTDVVLPLPLSQSTDPLEIEVKDWMLRTVSSCLTLSALQVSVPSGFGLSVCARCGTVPGSALARRIALTISAISSLLSHAVPPKSLRPPQSQ